MNDHVPYKVVEMDRVCYWRLLIRYVRVIALVDRMCYSTYCQGVFIVLVVRKCKDIPLKGPRTNR